MPLIVTIHDLIYFEKNPLFTKGYSSYQRFGNLYRRFVVKRLLHHAHKIITVSEFEKQRFLDMFPHLDLSDIRVVYNGVGEHFRHDISDDEKKQIRAKYELPDDFILFLGNTDPKKNTRNTLEAWARSAEEGRHGLPLVVGDLDPDKVMEWLKKIGLSKWMKFIHFPGYIRNTELPAIIASARVFLYPSKRESFGIPVLEGMACGTPVITSNVTSMPEVGGDAALFVDPHSVESIKEAILYLLSHPEEQMRLSEKGLLRAAEFSWRHTAEETLKIYKEIHNAEI